MPRRVRKDGGRGPRGAPVRYAVVGLGHIAQAAVLPAFAHAKRDASLVALVSDDTTKLRVLGRRYSVEHLLGYGEYGDLLESGAVDAVFVALPNSMHLDFTVRAAEAGVHVLCEKPLGVTEAECRTMIRACDRAGVRLMTAYRLHFEAANLKALEVARSGKIGDLRAFSSVFTMQVRDPGNIRLRAETGGGPLHDIGIYCINAARTLFGDEPESVFAESVRSGDARFREIDETVSVVMRFGGDRVAGFICSFGAADVSSYRLVGTRGDIVLEPAYEYAEGLRCRVTVDGKARVLRYAKRDQFAAELVYFSRCVRRGTVPEPSGLEGLADVRVIEAALKSIRLGRPVALRAGVRPRHPAPRQRIDREAVRKRRAVHAKSPSGD